MSSAPTTTRSRRRPLARPATVLDRPGRRSIEWWEYRAMQRRLRTLSEVLGGHRRFRLSFVPGAGCYTDFTNRLTVIDPHMVTATDVVEAVALVKAKVAHEAAHVAFTTPRATGTLASSWIRAVERLTNILEDERIERALAMTHWGAEPYLQLLRRRMWEQSPELAGSDDPNEVLSAMLLLRFGHSLKGALSAKNAALLEQCRPHMVAAWNAPDTDAVRRRAEAILRLLGVDPSTAADAMGTPSCSRSMDGRRDDAADDNPCHGTVSAEEAAAMGASPGEGDPGAGHVHVEGQPPAAGGSATPPSCDQAGGCEHDHESDATEDGSDPDAADNDGSEGNEPSTAAGQAEADSNADGSSAGDDAADADAGDDAADADAGDDAADADAGGADQAADADSGQPADGEASGADGESGAAADQAADGDADQAEALDAADAASAIPDLDAEGHDELMAREAAEVEASYGRGAGGPSDADCPLAPAAVSEEVYHAGVARAQVLRRLLEQLPPRPRSRAVEDGPRYSFRDELRHAERPMRRRDVPTRKRRIAMGVLVDCSGSMAGAMDHVRESVLATYLAASDLRVPFAVWGFSSWTKCPAAEVVPFGMNPSVAPEAIAGLEATGGTTLAPALEQVRRAIRGVPADRRVLLVIHDGQPSDLARSRDLVRAMRREAEVVGIFLGDEHGHADLTSPMRELFGERLIVAPDAEALMTILGTFLARLLRPAQV